MTTQPLSSLKAESPEIHVVDSGRGHARARQVRPAGPTEYRIDLAARLVAACGHRTIAEIGAMTGVNHETTRRYLRGKTTPTPEFLARLCVALDLSASWLLLGTDPEAGSSGAAPHTGTGG